VSQKTGKGNMKGQSAYFKVFARPCFTGNSRKYNPPYNQNREINRNTNPNNIANRITKSKMIKRIERPTIVCKNFCDVRCSGRVSSSSYKMLEYAAPQIIVQIPY
jgi:hypothetical protein